ncbi:MAG TPA: hypothetical protein GXX51_06490 [Firmicutes bacterium]|nr:hypothetical protein [Bacillota bacterium]
MSFIEVLIALAVLALAVTPLIGLVGSGVRGAGRADEVAYATDLAREEIEAIRNGRAEDLAEGTVTRVITRPVGGGEGGGGHALNGARYEVVREVTASLEAGGNTLWLVRVRVYRYPGPSQGNPGESLVSLGTYVYAGGV